jgi:hypothetical protein
LEKLQFPIYHLVDRLYFPGMGRAEKGRKALFCCL